MAYDRIFLTRALAGVYCCENHAADAHVVNAKGPRFVARITADKGAHVTYISTDMVFWFSMKRKTAHILKLTCRALGQTEDPASGIFHLCNSEPCSWRDWGQYCIETAREAGLPVITREITPVAVDSVKAFVAKHMHNSALVTSKFQNLTGVRPREWRETIRDHVMQNITRHE